jgi:hypothetical protein
VKAEKAAMLVWKSACDDVDRDELSALCRRFGFLRMKTAMALFENRRQQIERGIVDED